MPDMEKVINALHCRGQDLMIDLPACDGCDYQIQMVNRMGCDFRRLCKDAIALLKEQGTANLYKCPNCGTWVSAKNVVRCKDCKFWYKDECSHLCKITGDLHPANWFCADGEPKE